MARPTYDDTDQAVCPRCETELADPDSVDGPDQACPTCRASLHWTVRMVITGGSLSRIWAVVLRRTP